MNYYIKMSLGNFKCISDGKNKCEIYVFGSFIFFTLYLFNIYYQVYCLFTCETQIYYLAQPINQLKLFDSSKFLFASTSKLFASTNKSIYCLPQLICCLTYLIYYLPQLIKYLPQPIHFFFVSTNKSARQPDIYQSYSGVLRTF